MTPIAIVEGVATLLWVYAGLTLIAWFDHLRRTDRQAHVPHVVELIANLVPAMIALLLVVMAGAMIGLPSVVVIIAVLFPAGLAYGLHMSLNDIRETATPGRELARIGGAFVLAALVIWSRQIA
jgi:hypothetical protein